MHWCADYGTSPPGSSRLNAAAQVGQNTLGGCASWPASCDGQVAMLCAVYSFNLMTDCTAETMYEQAKIIHHVTHGHTFKVSVI